MNPTVHMSIGVPAAGKSTFLKQLQTQTEAVYVCPDELREEILGDYRNQSQNERIWKMAFDRIDKALEKEQDVIVDGAAITRYHRISDIKHYREHGARQVIGYWVQTPLDVSVSRNQAREKPIPDGVIEQLYQQLEGPERPELSDGFDEIKFIKPSV